MVNEVQKEQGSILVVDDDPYILLSLKTLLEQYYPPVLTLGDPAGIPEILRNEPVDLILLDMNFKTGDTSGREGLKYLKKIVEAHLDISVVVITAYGGIHMAVKAMKAGAFDFIIKPWLNEKILSTVSAAFKLIETRKKVSLLKVQQQVLSQTIDARYSDMLGQSEVMKQVCSDIARVAGTDANVLILGENGTGKELAARSIHRQSQRPDAVFISVDLGALSENLFESELFGHVKGAFTDAKEDRTGRFEAASGGTLFLDEIGNLPLNMQSKLLSALENRQVYRVGSNQAVDVDIRLICATNLDLKTMVQTDRFREDLLYRINTVEIELPPLRDRPGDVRLLANYFLELISGKYRKPDLSISDKGMKLLESLPWRGNVRELHHAIERAVILSESPRIDHADFNFLKGQLQAEKKTDSFNLAELERRAIEQCLQKYKGNVSKAADELGLTRGALYRRINRYGI